MPRNSGFLCPFAADLAGARFVQLYLCAHRVDGLYAGVYRFWPEHAELEQIRSGYQGVAVAAARHTT